MRATNRTRNCTLAEEGVVAANPFTRLRGLLGRPPLRPGQGLLLRGDNAIHTFGMGYPIDVLFLERSGRIAFLYESMAPLRASRFVFGAADVLELPAGTIQRTGTRVGDIVSLEI